jgi:hypothetical protein
MSYHKNMKRTATLSGFESWHSTQDWLWLQLMRRARAVKVRSYDSRRGRELQPDNA